MEPRNPTEQAEGVSSQPNLFDPEAVRRGSEFAEAAQPQPTSAAPSAPVLTGWRLWAERISLVVYVVFCIELGMLLAVIPWLPVWTDNTFVANSPWLHALAHQNFVRGLVTGLGLIDIWLGIWEAVKYREAKAPAPPTAP